MELGQDAVAATFIGRLRSEAIPLPDSDGLTRERKRARVEAGAVNVDADTMPAPEAQEPSTTSNTKPHGGRSNGPAARFDIRCNRCMKIGHKAKDCVEESLSRSRCYKCGEEGHAARQCKLKGSLDQFGPRRFEAKRIFDTAPRAQRQGPRPRTHEELDAQLAAYSGTTEQPEGSTSGQGIAPPSS